MLWSNDKEIILIDITLVNMSPCFSPISANKNLILRVYQFLCFLYLKSIFFFFESNFRCTRPPVNTNDDSSHDTDTHTIWVIISLSYYTFVYTLSIVPIPKTISKALECQRWRDVMIETAFYINNTWNWFSYRMVSLCWVSLRKASPASKIDWKKARLVANRCT